VDRHSRIARTTRSFSAQRINAGLTGLAAIFLIVVSAAAGIRSSRPASPVDPKAETLAVLGVAPSSGTDATLNKSAPPVRPATRALSNS
jgi:hypothetical protein